MNNEIPRKINHGGYNQSLHGLVPIDLASKAMYFTHNGSKVLVATNVAFESY